MTNLILEAVGGKAGGVWTFNLSPIFSFLLRDANKGQGVLHGVSDRLVNKCLTESVLKFSDPFRDLLSMLLFKVFLI